MIAGSTTIFFDSELHRLAHELLRERDFHFEMSPGMFVGTRYWHRGKKLEVHISKLHDEFWATLYATDHPTRTLITETSYSDKEWDWVNMAGDDPLEFLRRELFIMIDTRPNFMIRPPVKLD